MSSTKSKAVKLPTSFDLLSARLQKIINAPAAQKAHSAVICKSPDENQDDWNSILEAIAETDGVHIFALENAAVRISWEVPQED